MIVDKNGHHLLFAVKRGSADSYLWKITVRIYALKVILSVALISNFRIFEIYKFFISVF